MKLLMQARFKVQETGNPRHSLPLVEQALALDPKYAEAHSYKGILLYLHAEGGYETPKPYLHAARECAEKALALDPRLAEAHLLKSRLNVSLDLDFTLAADALREAERLLGYRYRYYLLGIAGHPEASLQECMDAIERDPLNWLPSMWAGMNLDVLGRLEESSKHFDRAVEIAPRNVSVFLQAFTHLWRFVKDLDALDRFVAETKYTGAALPSVRAHIALARGESEPLRSLVEDWVVSRDNRYVSASFIEEAYFELGDYESYFRWNEETEREMDNLPRMKYWLRTLPDYWERLTEWALEDADQARSRMALVNEQRDRIERITKKMVLPSDFVAETKTD
jgi:tetratricopeptide (TPR) repeat protein